MPRPLTRNSGLVKQKLLQAWTVSIWVIFVPCQTRFALDSASSMLLLRMQANGRRSFYMEVCPSLPNPKHPKMHWGFGPSRCWASCTGCGRRFMLNWFCGRWMLCSLRHCVAAVLVAMRGRCGLTFAGWLKCRTCKVSLFQESRQTLRKRSIIFREKLSFQLPWWWGFPNRSW